MSQASTIWEINGLSLECDATDADVLDKISEATDLMADDEKALPKIGKASDRVRAYCDMFYKYFDHILGEGTGEKIFGGKKSAAVCNQVYMSFLDHVRAQRDNIYNFGDNLNQYSPNRAQRRAVQKSSAKKKSSVKK